MKCPFCSEPPEDHEQWPGHTSWVYACPNAPSDWRGVFYDRPVSPKDRKTIICEHCLRPQLAHERHQLCEYPTRLVPSGRIAHKLERHADCDECRRGRVPVEYQVGWPWTGDWQQSHVEPWHVRVNRP